MSNNFHPNWASSPSSTILDILKDKNISIEGFANKLNRDVNFVHDLLYGSVVINNELAQMLEKSIGATTNFWLKREYHYRESINRLTSAEEQKWITELPYKEMQKLGWIPNTKDILNSCLNFFGVPDIWTWKIKYSQLIRQTSFRTSYTFQSKFLSVCSWLRKGEIECSKINLQKFNSELFKSKLTALRLLSKKKNPKDFIPEMIRICAECGVALGIIQTPKGCAASGATYYIGDNPIILLSLRYGYDDHFWFTFFHEVGHVLLHNKKEVFIEDLDDSQLDDKEEKEANSFSSHILIPQEIRSQFQKLLLTKNSIIKFAVENGISPGIVIGQLQFSGRIGFHQLNGYKRKYNWADIVS